MKPQSCKAKGRRLQQQIVDDLLLLFPHLTRDDVRSTSMGAGGEDIQLSTNARRSIPFSIEAKNQERVNVWAALNQCRSNAPENTEAIVVLKKNGENPHVLLSWSCFKSMLGSRASSNADLGVKQSMLMLADQLQILASRCE